jgi:signal transduction histidine kinase
VLVAAVALAGAASLSRVAVRTEYRRFETRERTGRLAEIAGLVAEELAAAAPPERLDGRLSAFARSLGQPLILLGPQGAVLGASAPDLRDARYRVESAGELAIERHETEAGITRLRRLLVVGGPRVAVPGGGTIYALPARDGEAAAEPAFVSSVNRWLVLAALGSGGLALLLSAALSRRILRPVEALTAAARRMAAGELGTRVDAGSADEIGELARAFNHMAERVESSVAAQRAIVADASHELRTPLTNLRGQIEALQDGLQASDERTLRSLHEEALLLSRLVTDLEELALAESGQLPLHRGPVAVAEVVDAAITGMGASAAARDVHLKAEVEDVLVVDADRERLGQVLRNLLANAVAHTPPGGTVTVAARGAGDGVEVAVTETGPGIPPEHLPHVFDRFYRADPARARATGGAGLGLAIVKQLVEAHGGRVRADRARGGGAVVTVTLPRA